MEDANLISKTRRKKQMHDLQALGAALVKLPADQLRRIELPDDLREAVEACRPMTKHEAIRRQMQYIGKLMRHLEAGPIAAQLEALNAPAARETARFHRAERWRDALLAEGDGLERFVQEFPEADVESLRRLAAAAREERAAERPPRRYRELFQAINAILQTRAKGEP